MKIISTYFLKIIFYFTLFFKKLSSKFLKQLFIFKNKKLFSNYKDKEALSFRKMSKFVLARDKIFLRGELRVFTRFSFCQLTAGEIAIHGNCIHANWEETTQIGRKSS